MKSAPHLISITLLVQVFVTVGALEQQQQQGSSQGSSPSDADGGYCQDRFGILDAASFTSRSCVMCYVFLFPMRKDLVPLGPNYEHLVPRNHTLYLLHGPISPDPDNATSVEQVCGLLANEEECSRWVSCCEAANACCQQQHSKPRDYDVTNTCHRVWDGYSCWDDTPGGTTVSVACPPFLALSLSGRVSSKQCIKNGTWYQKAGYEWTDYTSCLDKEDNINKEDNVTDMATEEGDQPNAGGDPTPDPDRSLVLEGVGRSELSRLIREAVDVSLNDKFQCLEARVSTLESDNLALRDRIGELERENRSVKDIAERPHSLSQE